MVLRPSTFFLQRGASNDMFYKWNCLSRIIVGIHGFCINCRVYKKMNTLKSKIRYIHYSLWLSPLIAPMPIKGESTTLQKRGHVEDTF